MTNLRQETVDTYNKSAQQLAAYFKGIGPRKKDIEKALRLAGKTTGARALEIGCGDGRDAAEITKHCSFFVAFDISEELVKIAQEAVPNVTFQVSDAVTFDFPAKLDVVYAFASLLHLDKDEFKVVCEKVANSLRSGGIFYISLKHREGYQSDVKVDEFGTRLFYFYDQKTVEKLAGTAFETAEAYTKHHGNTEWLEIALRRI